MEHWNQETGDMQGHRWFVYKTRTAGELRKKKKISSPKQKDGRERLQRNSTRFTHRKDPRCKRNLPEILTLLWGNKSKRREIRQEVSGENWKMHETHKFHCKQDCVQRGQNGLEAGIEGEKGGGTIYFIR